MRMLVSILIGIFYNTLGTESLTDNFTHTTTPDSKSLVLPLTQQFSTHYIINNNPTSAVKISLEDVLIGNAPGALSSVCQLNYVLIYDSSKANSSGWKICGGYVKPEWKEMIFCSSNVSISYHQMSSIDFGFTVMFKYQELQNSCYENSCNKTTKCTNHTSTGIQDKSVLYKCDCVLGDRNCEDNFCQKPLENRTTIAASEGHAVLEIEKKDPTKRNIWTITTGEGCVVVLNITRSNTIKKSRRPHEYQMQIFDSSNNETVYVINPEEIVNGVKWISKSNEVTIVYDHPVGDTDLQIVYFKESLASYETIEAKTEYTLLTTSKRSNNINTTSVWFISVQDNHFLYFNITLTKDKKDMYGNDAYIRFENDNNKTTEFKLGEFSSNNTEHLVQGNNVTVTCFPSAVCADIIQIRFRRKPLEFRNSTTATSKPAVFRFKDVDSTKLDNMTYILNINSTNAVINVDLQIDLFRNSTSVLEKSGLTNRRRRSVLVKFALGNRRRREQSQSQNAVQFLNSSIGSTTIDTTINVTISCTDQQTVILTPAILRKGYSHTFHCPSIILKCHSSKNCRDLEIKYDNKFDGDYCQEDKEIVTFSQDVFIWPKYTPVNTLARLPCPPGFWGMATRYCGKESDWDKSDLTGCVSREIKRISDETYGIFTNEVVHPELFNNLTSRLTNATALDRCLYPGDLATVAKTVNNLANIVKNTSASSNGLGTIAQGYGEAVDNIVDHTFVDVWTYASEIYVKSNMMLILESIESLSANVAKKKIEAMHRYKREITPFTERDTVHVGAKNLEFDISFHERLAICEDTTILTIGDNTHSQVSISSSVFKNAIKYSSDRFIQIYAAKFSSMAYFLDTSKTISRNSQIIHPFINSDIISSKVLNIPEEIFQHLSKPVTIMLELKNKTVIPDLSEKCVFLNMSSVNNNTWTGKGCSVDIALSNSSHVACKCTHLTNFAVLMDVFEIQEEIDHTDYTILTYISYIGGVMSVLACCITVVVFQCFSLRKERNRVHQQLAISIILSQVFFLVGIDRTENKYVCTALAALMHYSLTSMFCWMLVEGVHLYVMLVKVFRRRANLPKYLLFGWGFPLLVVGVSFGVLHDQYGDNTRCWLTHNVLLWVFVPTVGLVIVINSLILVIVLRIMMKSVLSRANMEERSAVKAGLKAATILLPLLGITWTLGFLSVNNREALFFTYLFTVCNSLQGVFFFLFHCLLNNDVRSAFERRSQRRSMTKLLTESLGHDNKSKKSSTLKTNITGKASINSILTDETYLDKKKLNGLSNNNFDRVHREHLTTLYDKNYHFSLQKSLTGSQKWQDGDITKEFTFYDGKKNLNILNGQKNSLNDANQNVNVTPPGDFRIEDLYTKPVRKRTVSEENRINDQTKTEDKTTEELKEALVQELRQRIE